MPVVRATHRNMIMGYFTDAGRVCNSPELELRQSSNEGLELIGALHWQRWALRLRVHLRR